MSYPIIKFVNVVALASLPVPQGLYYRGSRNPSRYSKRNDNFLFVFDHTNRARHAYAVLVCVVAAYRLYFFSLMVGNSGSVST